MICCVFFARKLQLNVDVFRFVILAVSQYSPLTQNVSLHVIK